MRVSPSNLLNAQSYVFFAKEQNYFSTHFRHIFASIEGLRPVSHSKIMISKFNYVILQPKFKGREP